MTNWRYEVYGDSYRIGGTDDIAEAMRWAFGIAEMHHNELMYPFRQNISIEDLKETRSYVIRLHGVNCDFRKWD